MKTSEVTDQALYRASKISRRARSKFLRRIADELHAMLRQDISENADLLISVIAQGGALRVGIEVAMPDTVVEAASDA